MKYFVKHEKRPRFSNLISKPCQNLIDVGKVKMQNRFDIIIISELGVDYVSPENHVAEKQHQNGSVNGKDIKQLIDPYDELIKNHLQKEEKIKVC